MVISSVGIDPFKLRGSRDIFVNHTSHDANFRSSLISRRNIHRVSPEGGCSKALAKMVPKELGKNDWPESGLELLFGYYGRF